MSRNPTLKRILRESAELASHPSPDFTASPLENDLYEWHFTLRGPPSPSPFEQGIYHGRIVLPPAYPLKPPSFRFLTPTGRFEMNREICLSISGHHEETWQPAWGIRTALVAIRSFMDSDSRGQVGGMDASEEVRRRLAGSSRSWKCPVCARSNEEILREVEAAAGEQEGGKGKDEVPEELRLAYREDLGKKEEAAAQSNGTPAPAQPSIPSDQRSTTSVPAQPQAAPQPQTQTQTQPQARNLQPQPAQQQIRPQQQTPLQQRRQPQPDEALPPWIDKAIYGVLGMLAFLVWKKLATAI